MIFSTLDDKIDPDNDEYLDELERELEDEVKDLENEINGQNWKEAKEKFIIPVEEAKNIVNNV